MKRLFLYIYILYASVLAVAAMPTSELTLPDDTTSSGWYNLGNAFYKSNEIGKAALCYERALRLNPSDDDVAYNLAHLRLSVPDRFGTPAEMFFVSWAKQMIYGRRAISWLMLSLVFLAAMLVAWLLFYHTSRTKIKRIAFFVCLLFAFFTVLSVVSAYVSHHRFATERRAVVMQTTPVRQRSTRTAPADRQLHAGTAVTLTGILSPDSLAACLLPDGTEAWIDPRDTEEVK